MISMIIYRITHNTSDWPRKQLQAPKFSECSENTNWPLIPLSCRKWMKYAGYYEWQAVVVFFFLHESWLNNRWQTVPEARVGVLQQDNVFWISGPKKSKFCIQFTKVFIYFLNLSLVSALAWSGLGWVWSQSWEHCVQTERIHPGWDAWPSKLLEAFGSMVQRCILHGGLLYFGA